MRVSPTLSWSLQSLALIAIALLLLRALSRTAGRNAAYGVAGMLSLYFVTRFLDLQLLAVMMEKMLRWGVLLLVIIFREEARTLLGMFGKQLRYALYWNHKLGTVGAAAPRHIEEISLAVDRIIQHGAGALIVLEMDDLLDQYASAAQPIDAPLSASLVEAVFTSKSHLHDGAMLIRGRQILAAGAVLPLSTEQGQLSRTGTRHRAALGLSERTDAAVIVVSEERGTIHLARNGRLIRVNPEHTRLELLTLLSAGPTMQTEREGNESVK